jgi:hypothetical protein
MIGRFWFERIGQPNVHPLVALLVGQGILLVLTSIPWIGCLFGLAAVIYGAGVVVRAVPGSRPTMPQPDQVVAQSTRLTRPTPSAGY